MSVLSQSRRYFKTLSCLLTSLLARWPRRKSHNFPQINKAIYAENGHLNQRYKCYLCLNTPTVIYRTHMAFIVWNPHAVTTRIKRSNTDIFVFKDTMLHITLQVNVRYYRAYCCFLDFNESDYWQESSSSKALWCRTLYKTVL